MTSGFAGPAATPSVNSDGILGCRGEHVAVEVQEDSSGRQRQPLVPVDHRVILDERAEEECRLVEDGPCEVRPTDGMLWSGER